jgi:hypothetical protein
MPSGGSCRAWDMSSDHGRSRAPGRSCRTQRAGRPRRRDTAGVRANPGRTPAPHPGATARHRAGRWHMCLALAHRLDQFALTADRHWTRQIGGSARSRSARTRSIVTSAGSGRRNSGRIARRARSCPNPWSMRGSSSGSSRPSAMLTRMTRPDRRLVTSRGGRQTRAHRACNLSLATGCDANR